MLNGSNNKGKPRDDDFMIMVSGDNYHTVDYKLPTPPGGGKWQLVFDSSQEEFASRVQQFEPGSSYALKPYSYVILTHKNNIARGQRKHVESFGGKKERKKALILAKY